MNKILILTDHNIKEAIMAITKYYPNKIIVLTDNSYYYERNREKLASIFQWFINMEFKKVDFSNIVEIAKSFNNILNDVNNENSENKFIINFNTTDKSIIFGIMFSAYSNNKFIDSISFFDNNIHIRNSFDLPILSYNLSDIKKNILKYLIDENEKSMDYYEEKSVENIASVFNISKPMIYTHINQLRNMGFIEEKSLKLTTAAYIAIL
ncbi:MAG: ArsR family transcriptional regulator [Methanobrevibacter sp.]|jgi:CRISPR-associated protein Csa3|nr:ArsR family transcriptional regulator [Candidatus Methanoflexus mossambicus]